MRPLLHPPIDSVTLEGILHALSDPVRLAIFSDMALSECPQNCTNLSSRISEKTIPKSTLSQHFKVLRDSGLIRSERQGVECKNVSRRAEIEERFPGLLAGILTAYRNQTV
jgi:DNA-binding transcriptional ArsR family regulator